MINFLIPFFMSFTSRMTGGGWPPVPWGLAQWIYALPVLLFYPLMGFWIVPVYCLMSLAKRIGTAPYMDMGTVKTDDGRSNPMDFFIGFLKDKIPRYWYDFLGMTLTGLYGGLALGISLIYFGSYVGAAAVLIFGGAKGLAYMIGWEIIPEFQREVLILGKTRLIVSTEIAEFLAGFFQGFGVLLALGLVTA